jgi:nucleotide-binding universal stress UspA family protein
MYRSLLVPLDGSTFGEHALPLALSIARRAKAALRLAHVHVPPAAMYVEGAALLDSSLESEAKEHERAYLDAVVKRLASDPAVSLTSALLEGSVADSLHEHAVAMRTDLVVMTTHGRGPLARFWLGSVADQLVRRLPMPLLLVRPQETAPDPSREQVLRHVLIPLDGSALAEQILEPAVALGSLMQADYTLLRVTEPMMPVPSEPLFSQVSGFGRSTLRRLQALHEQAQAEARTYLEGVAERLRSRGLDVQTCVVSHDQPAPTILDEARTRGMDLIALATHGRGGLPRLFLGSVADKVLRGAATPVLVHRPLDS